MVYLDQFVKQISEAELFDIMLLTEHCLVKVLKRGNIMYNYGLPSLLAVPP